MADDDRRMHEGDTPGLAGKRGHERQENPVSEGDSIGQDAPPPRDGDQGDTEEAGSTTDRDQESALGGHAAARSTGP